MATMQEPTKTEGLDDLSNSETIEGPGLYQKIVLQVVAKIRNEPFLFVIAVVSLLIGLTMVSAKLGSPDLRFIVFVVAVLAFAVILGYYMLAALQVRARGKGQAHSGEGAALQAQTIDKRIEAIGNSGEPNIIGAQAIGSSNNPRVSQAFESPGRQSPLSNKRGNSLSRLLAEIYDTQEKSRRVVDGAGLTSLHIKFQDDAIDNWHNVLAEARKRGKVEAIVEFVTEEYPERENELKVLVQTSPR